jgi:hypothetical protein
MRTDRIRRGPINGRPGRAAGDYGSVRSGPGIVFREKDFLSSGLSCAAPRVSHMPLVPPVFRKRSVAGKDPATLVMLNPNKVCDHAIPGSLSPRGLGDFLV